MLSCETYCRTRCNTLVALARYGQLVMLLIRCMNEINLCKLRLLKLRTLISDVI